MKVSKAESKICPFIQHAAVSTGNLELKQQHLDNKYNAVNINCTTSKCMAWMETKTRSDRYDLTEEEGYCIRLQEIEEQIVGFKQGAFTASNYESFMHGSPFEYRGSKDDFITLKKKR